MKIGSKPHVQPSVIFVITKYLLHQNAPLQRLPEILQPYPEKRSEKDFTDNVRFGLELKLFKQNTKDEISLESKLKEELLLESDTGLSQKVFLKILRTKVLKTPKPKLDGKGEGGDFLPVLAWWLGLSPQLGVEGTGKLNGVRISEIDTVFLQQDTQWNAWFTWAKALGFASSKSYKNGSLYFPDLTTPIEEILVQMGPGKVQMKGESGFLETLRKEIPGVDHSPYAKKVEKYLGVSREAKAVHDAGPVIYEALYRLAKLNRIQITRAKDNASKNAIFLSPYSDELVPIAEVVVEEK